MAYPIPQVDASLHRAGASSSGERNRLAFVGSPSESSKNSFDVTAREGLRGPRADQRDQLLAFLGEQDASEEQSSICHAIQPTYGMSERAASSWTARASAGSSHPSRSSLFTKRVTLRT
jgi:hypothetical protein